MGWASPGLTHALRSPALGFRTSTPKEWCERATRATRTGLFSVQGAVEKIQPPNENWIPGLKNIQRASCSSGMSLCCRLFPQCESAGSPAAWQGRYAWYHEVMGLECSLSGGSMGGSVFKSTRVGKKCKRKEHGLPSGQEANHKENSFKTSPQGSPAHQPTPPSVCRGQEGAFLQSRASCTSQVSFLNKKISIPNGQLQPWDMKYSRRGGGYSNRPTDVAKTLPVLRS